MHFAVRNASEICVPTEKSIERVREGTVVARAGRIVWVGPERLAPASVIDGASEIDVCGGALLPALVDSHTHLAWAGDRIEDFTARSHGDSYAAISARGGGILTTVQATRAASKQTLVALTRARLEQRLCYGIGTTEIKSGYGLEVATELRQLEAVAELRSEGHDLEATLLAAHAVPRGIDRRDYIRSITNEMIPEVARRGLARFVDVFVEAHAYTADEAREIMTTARQHGLTPRLHADQLTAGSGAELAAELGAASADHLEHVSENGLKAMRDNGVVATLLPGAAVFLGENVAGLGKRIAGSGVDFAVATDANPGSSPMLNLGLAATLATTAMGLSVEQSIYAVTLGAARALRRDDVGSMAVGARSRLISLRHSDARSLVYSFGEPTVASFIHDDGRHRRFE